MWPADPRFQQAVRGSHGMTTRVAVYGPDGLLEPDLPVDSAAVTATLSSQQTRTATLSLDLDIAFDQNLIDPLLNQVVVYTGVAGVQEVPLFTGRIDTDSTDDPGPGNVRCVDRATEVIRAAFEVPWPVTAGSSTKDTMAAILADVDPNFVLLSTTAVMDAATPSLLFEDDRGQAMDRLGAAINAWWLSNRIGGFDLVANPYAMPQPPDPVWAFHGDAGHSDLIRVRRTRSRETIYNSFTVVTERTDGTSPIRVTARDVRPDSDTRWGGPFGKQNRVIKLQTPLTEVQARSVCLRLLAQSLALSEQWEISTPHNPLCDPGDVVTAAYRGEVVPLVVESAAYTDAPNRPTVYSARRLLYFAHEALE